jgi:EAL domain-containing protein (putative c-di-GMP-specific phosphodiesterase class I)
MLAFSEALMRVGRAGDGGYFSPVELVPLLERRGLVRLFDHRVLELAMAFLAEQPEAAVSVNVSPRSLADPEWLDAFEACTGAQPEDARRLIVEITETATIEDPARVAKLLTRIKQQGARIAIDDFGAGHTSLRHLRAFPIDILKLDGAFTQNLRRSTDDRFFVRTLLELAHHLGVETVAEWVDDDLQASMLCDWGITYLQGHLVGKAELWQPAGAHAVPLLAAS